MVEGLFLTMLSVSLSGACLMGAAEVLVRLLGGRISPDVRRVLWCLVLLRLLCPWGPKGGLLDQAAQSSIETVSAAAAAETAVWQPSHPIFIQPNQMQASGGGVPLVPALELLWAAGVAVALVRRGTDYTCLRRRLKETCRPAQARVREVYARLTKEDTHSPALWVSSAIACPMLVGLVRPAIYLPAGELSQEELEGVLSHELTHWRRKDLCLKWLCALATAIHWFNPAARMLAEQMDRDCELSCDQVVTRGWDGPRRARYGALLLRLAAGEGSPSAALFSQKQRLKERLISIMDEKKYGKKAAALGAAACLALVLTSTALGAYTGPAAVGEKLADLSAAAGIETEATPTELAWPLEVGETVELSALFMGRVHPITGATSQHDGIDIPKPAGTPVLAAAGGTVLEAEFDAAYGNYVVLQHGSMTTQYAHLQSFCVEPGQTVAAGENIGQVGSTGMSTGPHLHFGVTVDGAAVDPLTVLDSSVEAYIDR